MIEKTVRIRIDKRTRLRYVIQIGTGEVWIVVSQRKKWGRRKEVQHFLRPGDRNFVHYEYLGVAYGSERMWDVIVRAMEMSNEGGGRAA